MMFNATISKTWLAAIGALAGWILIAAPICRASSSPADSFRQGVAAYSAGKYQDAAKAFQDAVLMAPSTGAYYNLGNAQWQANRPGEAVLAWEHAQWLDPLDKNSRNNLRFARRMRLLETPQLAWYEICSTWLPPAVWPWLACVTFWLAVALVVLPGIFRARKAGWMQGLAAGCFAVFLLTLPALYGIHTRSRIGIVLAQNTPLRLTPTIEAQIVTKLPAGETARLEREKQNYIFVRAAGSAGWVERGDLGIVSAR